MRDTIVYDSSYATPIFNDKKWFKSIEPLPIAVSTLLSSSDLTQITHVGVVSFATMTSLGTEVTMEIAGALFQPSSPCNLVASLNLRRHGVFWDQNRDTLYHRPSGQILADLHCLMDVPVIYGEPTAT